ncbi:MAG TPA: glycosyltransferase family A protein [Polyangia bacterium]|nr:glycosyltransferase family A protein [Polyangia bacterium]
MPKVSLIIPCYDDGRFLDEAVESALAQTFQDFEIVIVDDGSTDPATVALLDSYARPRTRVLREPHRGVTAARNRGIAEAAGEYLSFFDADDRMQPNFLERTVAALDGDPALAFASCWVRLFGGEEWEWKAERCDVVGLLHDCSVATAALVRKRAVVEAGGFDPEMELGHEDWDLWLSIVGRGHRGVIVPEVLFWYRRRPESRSTVADRGGTYLELFRDRLHKHAALYREHLSEVVWLKEAVLGHQLREIANAERESAWMRDELGRARGELDGVRAAIDRRLRDDLARAHRDVEALHRSLSWRVTAPLRRAWELWRRSRS